MAGVERVVVSSVMIIASLMLLAWSPVAAVNPEYIEILQEGNSPPSVDVPDDQTGISATSTVFKTTCRELDAADRLRVTWDWGDGKLSVTEHQSNGGNYTALTSHTYMLKQMYNLTVWIDDLTGFPGHNVSDWGGVANIPLSDTPPVIESLTADKPTPFTGQLVTFSATAMDFDYDMCVVAFEFGDGTSVEVIQPMPHWTVSVQHTYLVPGVYSAFAYAFDGYIFSLPSVPISIEVSDASFYLELIPGWNFVTIPPVGWGYMTSTLGLATGDIVASWNPATQSYNQVYVVGVSPPFKDFAIAESTGYWIHAVGSETLALQGTIPAAPQSRTITVPATGGWAIIGFNSLRTDLDASDVPAMYTGGSVTQVVAYDQPMHVYKVYNVLLPFTDFSLIPGNAYWIFVTASGTLTYDP